MNHYLTAFQFSGLRVVGACRCGALLSSTEGLTEFESLWRFHVRP